MKLQISFDSTDLAKALDIAHQIAPYADILEVGTPLIYSKGVQAIEQFKINFPDNSILADTKIVDRSKDTVSLCAKAGADWITVMAGTNKNVIHNACTTAEELNVGVMLDLLDSASIAQSALDTKSLGVTAIMFHQPYDEQDALLLMDKWDLITGNANLPIFAAGHINRNNINKFLALKPHGIIIGRAIVEAQDPVAEAAFFKELCKAHVGP